MGKSVDKKIPEIYCALSVIFDRNVDVEQITESLKKSGISEMKVQKPKCEPILSLDVAIVHYEAFWYLDDALTKMFSKIHSVSRLKEIVYDFGGTFCVDIAFRHYGKYPALEFSGENMETIRFLEADISIDAY